MAQEELVCVGKMILPDWSQSLSMFLQIILILTAAEKHSLCESFLCINILLIKYHYNMHLIT